MVRIVESKVVLSKTETNLISSRAIISVVFQVEMEGANTQRCDFYWKYAIL